MKKILITLGMMITITTPIATMVACGESQPQQNSFTGSFSTSERETKFKTITTTVESNEFKEETKLLSISLPKVKEIKENAFEDSSLTSIYIPQATTIDNNAFNDALLTKLLLPQVITIKKYAFTNSLLISLSLPKILEIGEYAFGNSLIKSLSLPQVTNIGFSAFGNSPLTSIYLPVVKTIDDYAFESTINNHSTIITLPSKFNNKVDKDRLFDINNWDRITFHWV